MNMGQPNSYSTPMMHVTPPTRFGTYELGASPVVHKRKLKSGDIVEEMYVPVYYPNTVDMSAATAVSVMGGAAVGGVNIATGVGLITPRSHSRPSPRSCRPTRRWREHQCDAAHFGSLLCDSTRAIGVRRHLRYDRGGGRLVSDLREHRR